MHHVLTPSKEGWTERCGRPISFPISRRSTVGLDGNIVDVPTGVRNRRIRGSQTETDSE